MKDYTSPVVLENEELAEGVFASSGAEGTSTDCWTVTSEKFQYDADVAKFRVYASHHTDVVHITTQVTYTITFTINVPNGVYTEFGDWFDGGVQTVTFTRDLHANGYHSGDEVSFMVEAYMGSHDLAVAVQIDNIAYVCRHETNVQGGLD